MNSANDFYTTNPLTNPASNICIGCRFYPKNFDSITGRIHDYCSKTCAATAISSISSNLCIGCGAFPKNFDSLTGRTYDYCSKKCATTPRSWPNSTSSNLCIGCGAFPKNFDSLTGRTHDYCSQECAATARSKAHGILSRNASKGPPPGCCDFCYSKPRCFDGRKTHPFCDKFCAAAFKSWVTQGQGSASLSTNSRYQLNLTGYQPATQQLVPSHYQNFAETACLMCHNATKQGDFHFCGKACADKAARRGPIMLEVPQGHVAFNSVADQFRKSWRHTGKVYHPVRAVYKIIGSQSSQAIYDAYRANVEARGNFMASGKSAGNEKRRWHGTRRECGLGDNGYMNFCASPTCSLCCIVQYSFDLNRFGTHTGWGRFGRGLYTSSTSSKCDDYSSNVSSSPYKALLLNKVVVGNAYRVTEDQPSFIAPPPGYDSVLAEKGCNLNFDELVVYNNDAIRPSYLVLYDA